MDDCAARRDARQCIQTRTVERIRLGDLDKERKVAVRVRPRDVCDRDREDEPQHVVGAVREVHARLRLRARELAFCELPWTSRCMIACRRERRAVYDDMSSARTSFTSFRTRSAAKSERMNITRSLSFVSSDVERDRCASVCVCACEREEARGAADVVGARARRRRLTGNDSGAAVLYDRSIDRSSAQMLQQSVVFCA